MGMKAKTYMIYIPRSGARLSRYGRPTEAQGLTRRRKRASWASVSPADFNIAWSTYCTTA